MRILHILDHSLPLQSGYVFRTQAILRGQRALGWETVQLTGPRQGAARAGEENGFHFHRTPPPPFPLGRLPLVRHGADILALARRLEEVARETRPDLLHAHSPALNGVAAWRVAKRLGLPLVYEVRAFWEDAAVSHGTSRAGGARYRLGRALETFVLRRADRVITIAQPLATDIAQRGVPGERIALMPNGVEIARFRNPGETPPALRGIRRKGPVLAYVGSFYAYEGLPLLLQALPRILEREPETLLLLVGGGPEEENLRRLARELGLDDHVHFTGRLDQEVIPACYTLADVMIYPRLAMRLTDLVTPLKPLEALAAGRMVALSDVAGHRELMGATPPPDNPCFFAPGNADALAVAALILLAERSEWPARQARGAAWVAAERSWEALIPRYDPIYRAATAGRRAGT